ncbi:Bor/Iss family lipoprotein [Enterobacter vonholyi]|uniref:Bor family protein n=1 Tax=Enterobacter vonholyi TaxID=2797505 RepID=A0ABU6E7S4_9ENTR|nr:hypothetical protein [Enterobacter vonholyi]MEB6412265.1 Bor family protein [Enterobacter vonholyi]
MKFILLLLFFLFSILTTGCAKKVYVLHEGFVVDDRKTKSIEVFYFYDSFGVSEKINAFEICSDGVGGIEYDKSLIDSIVAIVTFSIITPRRVTFYCIN